jgi:ferredoxin
MRITVDDDRCAGHGICLTLRPEVFTLNDDGYAEAQSTDIPVEFQAAVREAIECCPEHAITEQ